MTDEQIALLKQRTEATGQIFWFGGRDKPLNVSRIYMCSDGQWIALFENNTYAELYNAEKHDFKQVKNIF